MGVRTLKELYWQVTVLDTSPNVMEAVYECVRSYKGTGKKNRGLESFSVKHQFIHLTWTSTTTYTNVWSWVALAFARDSRCADLKWTLSPYPEDAPVARHPSNFGARQAESRRRATLKRSRDALPSSSSTGAVMEGALDSGLAGKSDPGVVAAKKKLKKGKSDPSLTKADGTGGFAGVAATKGKGTSDPRLPIVGVAATKGKSDPGSSEADGTRVVGDALVYPFVTH